MKKSDAEEQIWQIWLGWADNINDKYGEHFGFHFYHWLVENKPNLLNFKYSGDKYQVINGWVKKWQSSRPQRAE